MSAEDTVYKFETFAGVPDPEIYAEVAVLNDSLFGGGRFLFVEAATKHNLVLVTARAPQTGALVGFKLGYQSRPTRFYSWLGGVAVEHRRRGIASRLMTIQHAHCRAAGYESVRTHSRNRFRGMLILNLRFGFDITGTNNPDGVETRIVMEKRFEALDVKSER